MNNTIQLLKSVLQRTVRSEPGFAIFCIQIVNSKVN